MPHEFFYRVSVSLLLLWPQHVLAGDVSESDAKTIALSAAGCKQPERCEVRGGLKDGQWIFVVSLIKGRSASGEPLFAPGGWVGITIDRAGRIIDRTPGV